MVLSRLLIAAPGAIYQASMPTPVLSFKVLLIEDDTAIRGLLRSFLRDSVFRLIEVSSAAEGLEALAEKRPDIVVLDLGLPDQDGIDVIRRIREWSQVPIIVTSARQADNDKVEALDAGADDYVTKPFSVTELIARFRVAIRHMAFKQSDDAAFESGPLRIDYSTRQVWMDGEPLKLTPLEYRLLSVLTMHAGKVVTQRQLLTEVWGPDYTDDSQYLRVYMGYLRRKLEAHAHSPQLIATEHRVGYRLML